MNRGYIPLQTIRSARCEITAPRTNADAILVSRYWYISEVIERPQAVRCDVYIAVFELIGNALYSLSDVISTKLRLREPELTQWSLGRQGQARVDLLWYWEYRLVCGKLSDLP